MSEFASSPDAQESNKDVPLNISDTISKAKTPSQRQCKKEKILNSMRLQNWKMKESEGYLYLKSKLGSDISLYNCRALAQTIEAYMGIQLDREAFRRKAVCIKWFDENLDKIKPFVEKHIILSFN